MISNNNTNNNTNNITTTTTNNNKKKKKKKKKYIYIALDSACRSQALYMTNKYTGKINCI